MFKSFLLFNIMLVHLAAPPIHPVHVSVTNVELNEHYLAVRISTFVDDWETAYFHYYGKQIDLTDTSNLKDGWFLDYLNKSFRLGETENQLFNPVRPDSIYFNDMSMILELQYKRPENEKTLYIYNAILTDIYADQTNLVIFTRNGKQKGIKFDVVKKHEELKLR